LTTGTSSPEVALLLVDAFAATACKRRSPERRKGAIAPSLSVSSRGRTLRCWALRLSSKLRGSRNRWSSDRRLSFASSPSAVHVFVRLGARYNSSCESRVSAGSIRCEDEGCRRWRPRVKRLTQTVEDRLCQPAACRGEDARRVRGRFDKPLTCPGEGGARRR